MHQGSKSRSRKTTKKPMKKYSMGGMISAPTMGGSTMMPDQTAIPSSPMMPGYGGGGLVKRGYGKARVPK